MLLRTKLFNFGINYEKNYALGFFSEDEKDAFFSLFPTYEVDIPPSFIKNIWRLNNEITIFDEGTSPTNHNYLAIKHLNIWHCYYIVDFEYLGKNQIKYYLEKDTITTFVLSNHYNINNKQIILREHKNRFNADKTPRYDKTLEDIEIKPTIVSEVSKISSEPTTLALRSYGGGVKDDRILSEVVFGWEAYQENPKTVAKNRDFNLEIPLGWGAGGHPSKVYLTWESDLGSANIIFVEDFTLVHIKEDDKHVLVPSVPFTTETLSDYVSITNNDNYAIIDNDKIILNGDGILRFHANNLNEGFRVLYDFGMELPLADDSLVKTFATIPTTTPYPTTQKARPLESLNRSSAFNQKIITLEYLYLTDFIPYFSNGFNTLRMPVNNHVFANDKTLSLNNPTFDTTGTLEKLKVAFNDPKLYTSQFNPYFLTFSNESFLIRRESFYTSTNLDINVSLLYNKESLTKALLKVATNAYDEKEINELTKVVNLDNEEAIMKSSLNDYINTQAENEKRLQDLQIAKAQRDRTKQAFNSIIGIGAGAVGGLIASGGNPAGALVGAGVGVVKSVSDYAFATKNLNQMREELKLNYENKIKSLQISLMNTIGGGAHLNTFSESNILKLYQFELDSFEKHFLDNYFHFFGYNTLEFKVPNLKTRMYFNYIKMEIINGIKNNQYITVEIENNIKERFIKGVTIFHLQDDGTFNFAQNYENFERT